MFPIHIPMLVVISLIMIEPDIIERRHSLNNQVELEPKYKLPRFYSDHQSRSTIQFIPKLQQSKLVSFVSPFDPSLEIAVRQQIFFELDRRHTLGLSFDAARVAQTSNRQLQFSHEYQDIHRHKVKTTIGFGSNWYLGWEAHKKLRAGMYSFQLAIES